ncbi:unnamed protein product, partial [Phaeothamnion confervicola]
VSPLHLAVGRGDLHAVAALLEAGASTDPADLDGGTPLALAIRAGSAHMVRLLVRFGANPEKRDGAGRSALHWAASCGHADELLKLGADPNEAPDASGLPMLHMVIAGGGRGGSGSSSSSGGRSGGASGSGSPRGGCSGCPGGFSSAGDVSNGGANVASGTVNGVIISTGSSGGWGSSSGSNNRSSARHEQAQRGDVVRALLLAGADIAARDRDGYTALHHAAMLSAMPTLNRLLHLGADVEAKANQSVGGVTPLFAAFRAAQLSAVERLLEWNADD